MSVAAADVIAAKMIVQLGLVGADEVRERLRAIDADASSQRDLINVLADLKRLTDKHVEGLRRRIALYEHVRAESAYLRLLERASKVPKPTVAKMIADLERTAFRRRIGEVLVKDGRLKKEQDAVLSRMAREGLGAEDERIVERYRAESFAGVQKPLIPGSRLDPDDFKISKLFRGKETRALVDEEGIRELRRQAADGKRGGNRATEDYSREDLEGLLESPPPVAAPEPPPPPADMDRVKTLKRIGEYDVVQVLGIGGMGAVFLGQREGTGEYVAIKVMLNQAASAAEKGRFRREVTLTRRIKHKNVIGIIDSGETSDGMTYLIVPTLVGKELRSFIEKAKGAGLEPELAAHIFEQTLEGLVAVHALKIVHRDLKPENLMILGRGHEVRIMDFGLAKLEEEAEKGEASPDALFRTEVGQIVGSPAYIAPESVSRDAIDGRTDIYSLGVIFFETLTGKLPIESDSATGYLTAHLVSPPATLAEARPDRAWPPELESLIARMLGKTRDERPESCKAILEEFRAIRPKLTTKALEPPPPEPPAPPPREPSAHGVLGLLGRLLKKS